MHIIGAPRTWQRCVIVLTFRRHQHAHASIVSRWLWQYRAKVQSLSNHTCSRFQLVVAQLLAYAAASRHGIDCRPYAWYDLHCVTLRHTRPPPTHTHTYPHPHSTHTRKYNHHECTHVQQHPLSTTGSRRRTGCRRRLVERLLLTSRVLPVRESRRAGAYAMGLQRCKTRCACRNTCYCTALPEACRPPHHAFLTSPPSPAPPLPAPSLAPPWPLSSPAVCRTADPGRGR